MLAAILTVNFFVCILGAFGAPLATENHLLAQSASTVSTHTSGNSAYVPSASFAASTVAGTATVPSVLERSSTTLSCPVGYDNFGKQCVKTITESPELRCSGGFSLAETLQCVRDISRISECPTGFEVEAGLCRRRQYAAVVSVCPAGYLINSEGARCSRAITLPSTRACPAGSIQKGDLCVIESTVASEYACPEGFNLDGNQCNIEEVYNCTPEVPEEVLALRRVGFTDHSCDEANGQCEDIHLRRAKSKGSDSTTQLSANGLTAQTQLLAVARHLGVLHAPGSALSTRSARAYAPPLIAFESQLRKRREGTTYGNSGVTDTTKGDVAASSVQVSANAFASRGAQIPTLQTTSQQEKADTQALTTTLSRSATAASTAQLATAVTVPSAPAVSAAQSYFQDYVVASTCSRIRTEPAHHVCARGVLNGETCLVTEEVDSITLPGAISEEYTDAVTECPDHYSPLPNNSTQCVIVDDVALTFYCPAGTTDLGDRCLQSVAAQVVCNAGFVLENDVCVQTQFAKPLAQFTVRYSCVGKECDDQA